MWRACAGGAFTRLSALPVCAAATCGQCARPRWTTNQRDRPRRVSYHRQEGEASVLSDCCLVALSHAGAGNRRASGWREAERGARGIEVGR